MIVCDYIPIGGRDIDEANFDFINELKPDDVIVGVENRDGNANVKFHQADIVVRFPLREGLQRRHP
ncbi:MAG: hypothetical protein NC095_04880 [Muribaculum sp.]|nr:hypothetical protein [Muribaculum sp.]